VVKVNCFFCFPSENGYVQKAVNYDGEIHIIEEVQLFQNTEPIDILRLYQNQVRNTGDGYRYEFHLLIIHFNVPFCFHMKQY